VANLPEGLRPGPPGPGGQRAGQNPVGGDRGPPPRPCPGQPRAHLNPAHFQLFLRVLPH